MINLLVLKETVYSEKRVKEFLREKNISFSLPKNITAVFYPVFYINGKMQSLNENFFYNWFNNRL